MILNITLVAFHEEGRSASQMIDSNVKELVEQEHDAFDSFWGTAIPTERIVEIEEGSLPRERMLLKVQFVLQWDLSNLHQVECNDKYHTLSYSS